MLNRLDWKFVLTLLITIAGVAVPVWLWQLDQLSKALTMTVNSTVELQPQGVVALDGVQVLLDGKPLNTPFVSTLELSNSGSKPIVASDFEGPVRISSTAPSVIVKARQTSSTSPSLAPELALTDGTVLLQPLLLNPGDAIRFTLVTANRKPEYSVRGRIAGVTEISISDATIKLETKRYWLGRGVITLLLVIYIVNFFEFAFTGLRRRTFMPRSFVTGLGTAFGASLIVVIQSPVDTSPISDLLPTMAVALLIAAPFVLPQLRRQSAA